MKGIERIKILASEIKDKPLLKIIEYLLTREDMNEKYLNEEKSLKQMVEFIKNSAKKQSTNGVAMVEDEVVFGWAIHYFDETNEQLDMDSNYKEVTKNDEEENVTKIELPKKQKKELPKKQKKEWVAEGQLSLFDL